jgi:PAS domain-containing protein
LDDAVAEHDPAGIPWMVLANRFLALFAIWVTAMVGYQRKRAEETLRMRDRALAATRNGVVITDARQPDDPVVYCNAGYERLTGYFFDEIVVCQAIGLD